MHTLLARQQGEQTQHVYRRLKVASQQYAHEKRRESKHADAQDQSARARHRHSPAGEASGLMRRFSNEMAQPRVKRHADRIKQAEHRSADLLRGGEVTHEGGRGE